jgi:transcriptional regulator with XRE-family HTH domain
MASRGKFRAIEQEFLRLPHQPEVSDAIRQLRETLKLTQQGLAVKLGTALTTIARWETSRSPRGRTLNDLAHLAEESGRPDLAAIFRKELLVELGRALRSQFRYAVRHQRQAASGAEALRNVVEELRRLSDVFHRQSVTKEDAIRAGIEIGRHVRQLEALLSAAQSTEIPSKQAAPGSSSKK